MPLNDMDRFRNTNTDDFNDREVEERTAEMRAQFRKADKEALNDLESQENTASHIMIAKKPPVPSHLDSCEMFGTRKESAKRQKRETP